MRIIIVGMGVQGQKRKKILSADFKYSVDKFKTANFKSIYEVPSLYFKAGLDKALLRELGYNEKKYPLSLAIATFPATFNPVADPDIETDPVN